MMRTTDNPHSLWCQVILPMVALVLSAGMGCKCARPRSQPQISAATPRQAATASQPSSPVRGPVVTTVAAPLATSPLVQQVGYQPENGSRDSTWPQPNTVELIPPAGQPEPPTSLPELEALALANNPTLRRMHHEAAAQWAKARYVGRLPDPSMGSTVYVPPMRFDPDRQVAELQVMQMIPWLARLDATTRQTHFEALVAQNQLQAERLRLLGDLRAAWFRLYVLGKQIETTVADQAQLEALVRTANARVATGVAQPGDVLMATLELSSLQEQLLNYRQQAASTVAEMNRLVGRDSQVPILPPHAIDAAWPGWNFDWLRSVAWAEQPEMNAARLQAAATRWGIEVARLQQRPDVTLSGGWVIMDAPNATMPGAGADTWTLGVSTTLPVRHEKYQAMVSEASHQHLAAHATEEEVALRLDASLRDLWEQARAAEQTVLLYEKSILPQARQTLAANQKALANNSVTFDRVIRDYRSLLSLELGYHRALGQLATTVARIRQTVGVDLSPLPTPPAAP